MFPKIIASSVIRSTHKGESHGGVYVIDLETNHIEQVIDWNDNSISWEGRGLDRGLRGIAFYKDVIILAASNEIYFYDPEFKLIDKFTNQYLNHCHEIFVYRNSLFVTSTGYDSILKFDLATRRFIEGYCVRPVWHSMELIKKAFWKFALPIRPKLTIFDPNNGKHGPKPNDSVHLNNVYFQEDKLFFSGTGLDKLWFIKNNSLFPYAQVPLKTHNTMPYKQGVLLNDTASDHINYQNRDNDIIEKFTLPRFERGSLKNLGLPQDHARQAFGRGLCLFGQNYIIGGSSPATVSIYHLGNTNPHPVKMVNISMDVRNSIHGLELWPF